MRSCTIVGHSTFKCFSPAHSGSGERRGPDSSPHGGILDCDANSALRCDLSVTAENPSDNTSSEPAVFSLARMGDAVLLRQWSLIKTKTSLKIDVFLQLLTPERHFPSHPLMLN